MSNVDDQIPCFIISGGFANRFSQSAFPSVTFLHMLQESAPKCFPSFFQSWFNIFSAGFRH
jgi:hypothetical protein